MAATGEIQYWQLPFPPGWERKWDANSNRYFYINHSNRNTQWDDPRIAISRHIQANRQQQAAAAAHPQPAAQQYFPKTSGHVTTHGMQSTDTPLHQLGAANGGDDDDDETSFIQIDEFTFATLKSMFASAPDGALKKCLAKNNNDKEATIRDLKLHGYQETVDNQQQSTSNPAVNRLKREFPSAEQSLIQDVLSSCNNYESEARKNLRQMFEAEGVMQQSPSVPVSLIQKRLAANNNSESDTMKSLRSNPWYADQGSSAAKGSSAMPSGKLINSTWKRFNLSQYSNITNAYVVNDIFEGCGFDDSKTRAKLRKLNSLSGELKSRFPLESLDMINTVLYVQKLSLAAAARELETNPTKRFPTRTGSIKMETVMRLKSQFPKVDVDIIQAALIAADGNVANARRQLGQLGYASSSQQQQQHSPPKRTTVTSSQAGSSAGSTGASSPAKRVTPSPTPKLQVSETEKKRLTEKFKKQYSELAATIIEMALEVSEFDEAKTHILLKSMSSPEESRTARNRQSSGAGSPAHRATTQSSSPRPASPASASGPDAPASVTAVNVSFPTPENRPSSSSSDYPGISESTSSSRPNTANSLISRRTPSPVNINRDKTHTASGPIRVDVLVTDLDGYRSENRSAANGPDPTLPKGPDRDLLIEHYVEVQGHQSSLAKGANHALVSGPSGAVGRDPSLVSGHNAELAEGAHAASADFRSD
ncbi:uncharacterized protein LOC141908694 isoform X2 [Tubulanus polymorphus]|uniref:uncharacterized protein LOC141908694 isoform X2 n=1 Tax=Tubulanus polymorphus TaxID=672921 RepID=UPI003DA3E305